MNSDTPRQRTPPWRQVQKHALQGQFAAEQEDDGGGWTWDEPPNLQFFIQLAVKTVHEIYTTITRITHTKTRTHDMGTTSTQTHELYSTFFWRVRTLFTTHTRIVHDSSATHTRNRQWVMTTVIVVARHFRDCLRWATSRQGNRQLQNFDSEKTTGV